MAVGERARHELFAQLERALGTEAATTLLEHLPPTGWGDVATKHDLEHLEERLDARFEAIDARFEAVDARIAETGQRLMAAFRGELVSAVVGQTRLMLFTMAGTVVSLVGLGLAFGGRG